MHLSASGKRKHPYGLLQIITSCPHTLLHRTRTARLFLLSMTHYIRVGRVSLSRLRNPNCKSSYATLFTFAHQTHQDDYNTSHNTIYTSESWCCIKFVYCQQVVLNLFAETANFNILTVQASNCGEKNFFLIDLSPRRLTPYRWCLPKV